ncbi:hypothetical protein [Amycolatopsis sp. H20-H5]|nr:hypothetical protein [Amycolatopsis sp. H20-H5]MEC3980826.1 hypothetical protein [Amycolatopsis sp. H20-H5]
MAARQVRLTGEVRQRLRLLRGSPLETNDVREAAVIRLTSG